MQTTRVALLTESVGRNNYTVTDADGDTCRSPRGDCGLKCARWSARNATCGFALHTEGVD